MTSSHQALIFGASGITGWAITNSALSYPSPTNFSRITGLTSRHLSLADAQFPSDPRLRLYAGLDLSKDAETITKYLSTIEGIAGVTHVFFAGKYSISLYARETKQKERKEIHERGLMDK
jgi:hypothetical protein